jgi:hypothetical protein
VGMMPLNPRGAASRWHALADDRNVYGGNDFEFLEKILAAMRSRQIDKSNDGAHRGSEGPFPIYRASLTLDAVVIRNDKVDGVAMDRNLTQNDSFGSSVLWLSTSGQGPFSDLDACGCEVRFTTMSRPRQLDRVGPKVRHTHSITVSVRASLHAGSRRVSQVVRSTYPIRSSAAPLPSVCKCKSRIRTTIRKCTGGRSLTLQVASELTQPREVVVFAL